MADIVKRGRMTGLFRVGARVSVSRTFFDIVGSESKYSDLLPPEYSRLHGTVTTIYAISGKVGVKWDVDQSSSYQPYDSVTKESDDLPIQAALIDLQQPSTFTTFILDNP